MTSRLRPFDKQLSQNYKGFEHQRLKINCGAETKVKVDCWLVPLLPRPAGQSVDRRQLADLERSLTKVGHSSAASYKRKNNKSGFSGIFELWICRGDEIEAMQKSLL